MTDAAHLLTDFCSILISIFSLWISSRPRTDAMTFGWHRAGELGILNWSYFKLSVFLNMTDRRFHLPLSKLRVYEFFPRLYETSQSDLGNWCWPTGNLSYDLMFVCV